MNVVIAIDSFKGSMTSLEAGESASAGIRRIYPDADITIRPLADGGEGTVDALTLGCGGTCTQVCVTGPLGKPVLCSYGILDAGKTAVIEMSGAAGITLLSDENHGFSACRKYIVSRDEYLLVLLRSDSLVGCEYRRGR